MSGGASVVATDVNYLEGGAKRAGAEPPRLVSAGSTQRRRSMFDTASPWDGEASLAGASSSGASSSETRWSHLVLNEAPQVEAPITDQLLRMLQPPPRLQPLEYMSVKDLRKILRNMGSDTFGTRAELIARIQRDDAAEVAAFFNPTPFVRLSLPEDHATQTLEMVMAAVSVDGLLLQTAALRFRRTDCVVRAAFANNVNSFKYASPSLYHETKSTALLFVAMNGQCMTHLSLDLRRDPDVIKVATETTPAAMQWARDPSNEAMTAVLLVPGCGDCIEYGTRCQRGWPNERGEVDFTWARLALRTSSTGNAVSFINEAAKAALKSEAVCGAGMALQWYRKNDPLDFCHLLACDDAALVLLAVAQDGLALQFASPELRATRAVVETAILQNPYAFAFASQALKMDSDLALLVAEKSFDALTTAMKTRVKNFDPRVLHGTVLAKITDLSYDVFDEFRRAASRWDMKEGVLPGQWACKVDWDPTRVVGRLSMHGPYQLKKITDTIGDFVGDLTGAKTLALMRSGFNLRYYNAEAVSTEHVKHARQRRNDLMGTFNQVCCRAGGAHFEGYPDNFAAMDVTGDPPPRIFTAQERVQVLLFLVTSPSAAAPGIAARDLHEGIIPHVSHCLPVSSNPILARF